MNEMRDPALDAYLGAAQSWSDDRVQASDRSRRTAWIIAGVAAAIALLEAIALVVLLPLKKVEPYTLLVDRQTGFVQELKPLQREVIAPDTALVRSFLVQYVIARESFDINALKESYRKVGLWSAGEARTSYVSAMQASNPASPLAALPRQALVNVQVRSVSSLSANTALVRYATVRVDPGGSGQPPQLWAAVVRYRFSGAAMSAADRLTNPLGFQVERFNRSAEIEVAPPPTPAVPAATPAGSHGGAPGQLPVGRQ
jgi:type IV secretion system protein VirB8